LENSNIEELIALRHELHQNPELSGSEEFTAQKIEKYISQFNPDEIVRNVGGTGLLVIFKGISHGPTVTFRCELDALPIEEVNTDLAYKSKVKDVSHKCGHDGHMAIVSGLAKYLAENKPTKGRVILLFQPAEETGEGAQQMLNDPEFVDYHPDFIFALHNLPGYPANQIIVKKNTFSAASKGLIVKMEWRTSHAAEPQNGISPAIAMANIVKHWSGLSSSNKELNITDFAITTVVHAQLGARAFGVSPGQAHVMATLRAYNDADLDLMSQEALTFAKSEADKGGLIFSTEETEIFSSTTNDEQSYNYIISAAEENNLSIKIADEPFRWSEDFGLFSQKHKGAMFGLGAGMDVPDLHNPDYDFPDHIIETGMSMFKNIMNQILNN
jgi:amidohydrolase